MTQRVQPPVEMLWEADVPELVLAHRFGFSDADSASEWVAATVLEVWGIPVDSCDRIVMSDHNALAWLSCGSESYIAKWSVDPERFARLAALANVTAWLGGAGLPVSAPIAALSGSLQVEVGAVSIALQRHYVGDLLDVSNENEVRAAGVALARLHAALAECPFVDELPQSANGKRQVETRIAGWLDSELSNSAPESAVQQLRRLVYGGSIEPLQAQLVHGDFRSANLLVANERIAAILDFEEARLDFPIVDLAQAAVLLGTQFRDWAPVSGEVRHWLLTGYQSVRPLIEVELQWWNALVLWFSLMFIPEGEDPTGWRAAAMDVVSAS
ncbi:phosphotransferase [soil metagenome]